MIIPIIFIMDYLVCAYGHQGYVNVFEVRKNGNPLRAMDPDQDIYPPPLMSSRPSRKCSGFDKLQMAVLYLQAHRVRNLITKHENDYKSMDPQRLAGTFSKEEIEKAIQCHDYGYNSVDDGDLIDIYSRLGPYGNILNWVCGASLPTNVPHEGNEFLFDNIFMQIPTPRR